MTAAEFQQRHPKPWRFLMFSTTFSLRDANGGVIAKLQLGERHAGIPQLEWNRHIEMGLREHIECVTELPRPMEELQKQIAP